jgi:hypothetical protein
MLDVRWYVGCSRDYTLCVSRLSFLLGGLFHEASENEQRADDSLALGVKMNILLFLPGAWVMLFQIRGLGGMLESTAVIALIQVLSFANQHRRRGADC